MAKKTETDPKPEKLFPDQLDGEEVLLMFRKHPIVMRKGFIASMAAWLIGPIYTMVLTYIRPNDIPSMTFFFMSLLASMALGVLILLPSWINWYYSIYIVTNERLIQITQKGLFNKSFVDLGHNQIQSLNYEVRGLQATLLGYGTILVQTYMGDLVIHEVHHPAKLYKELVTILREEGIEPVQMLSQDREERELSLDEEEA